MIKRIRDYPGARYTQPKREPVALAKSFHGRTQGVATGNQKNRTSPDRCLDLLAAGAAALIAVDPDGKVVRLNSPAEEVTGSRERDVRGRAVHDVLGVAAHERFGLARWRAGQPLPPFAITANPDGKRTARMTLAPVPLGRPREEGILAYLLFPAPESERMSTPPGDRQPLTARELQVLGMLADGEQTSAIANTLSISETTVRNHVQNILRKLKVHSRLEAVVYAHRHGLIER
jgi:DNA-binding CsgD family transcriptional regulator